MRYSFYVFSAVTFGFLALALLVGGQAIRATEPSAVSRGRVAASRAREAAGHLTGRGRNRPSSRGVGRPGRGAAAEPG